MNRPDTVEIERQVRATQARPLHTLPAAWFEPGVDERMAEWIKRWILGELPTPE